MNYSMNYNMVKRLILKDWYMRRWEILVAVAGGTITLGVIAAGGKLATMLGLILLVTIIIAIGVQLAIATIINERKEQTIAFVMSLPISYREYTTAKILGNLLIFLVPWVVLVLGSFAIVLFAPGMPHGLIPYVAIMSTEILVSTCLVAAVALTSESQPMTIGALIAGNLAFNGFGYYAAHVPSIARGMESASIQWSPTASVLLVAEFAAIVLLLSFTFFFQSRKKDFL